MTFGVFLIASEDSEGYVRTFRAHFQTKVLQHFDCWKLFCAKVESWKQFLWSLDFPIIFLLRKISFGSVLFWLTTVTNLCVRKDTLNPDMLKRIVIINPPFFLSVVWNFASMLFTEDTVSRIEVAETYDDMKKYIDAENLPKELNGTCETSLECGRIILPEDIAYEYPDFC